VGFSLHFIALPPEDAVEQEHHFCVGSSLHFLALPPEDAAEQ
jgi:hypothetical protein